MLRHTTIRSVRVIPAGATKLGSVSHAGSHPVTLSVYMYRNYVYAEHATPDAGTYCARRAGEDAAAWLDETKERVAALVAKGEATQVTGIFAPPSVPTQAEPTRLWDDEYTGPRYTYGLPYRPLVPYGAPAGWILKSDRPHPDFPFGTVAYPSPLTAGQMQGAELVPLLDEELAAVEEHRHAG